MKILIVTPLFPPQNAVGALRPYTWAKYWGRMGHEVDVMTVDSYGVESGLSLKLDNVRIYSTPIPILGKLAKKWHSTSINDFTKTKSPTSKSFLHFLKNLYRKFIDKTGCITSVRFPDMRDFWANKMIKKYQNNKYDFIISTGCPYSVHKIGLYYKKKNPNLFWIVDWRDLWTQNPYWKGFCLFRPYERYLEKKIHNKCDLITVVSTGLKDNLQKITTTTIEVIENGFDEEDYIDFLKNPKQSFDKFTIVYTGTIYKGIQDITPILCAMKELKEDSVINSENFQLITAGNVADLFDDVQKLDVSDMHRHLGVVPRKDALRLIYDSDASILLLGKNNKGILSGKLFEYLSLSNFIFGVDFANSDDAGKIIKEANAGECFDSDVGKIKEFLLKKMQEKESIIESSKRMDIINRYTRKKQAEKIISFVDTKNV